MQDNDVVAKMLEFECLEEWNYTFNVVTLFKDTKVQNEYGIVFINDFQAVIATFINKNHIVTKHCLILIGC